jgi:hypothetical protein
VSKLDKISQDILKVLEDHPSGVSITELAKNSKYHRNTISPRLNALLKDNKVNVKTTGKSKLYYLQSHAMIAEGGNVEHNNITGNISIGIGFSSSRDSKTAAIEAIENAKKDIKLSGPYTLGLLFSSSNYDIKKLVNSANKIFGNTTWVGCTTAGEISNIGATNNSCVVMIIKSEYIKLGIGVSKDIYNNPFECGKRSMKDAISKLKLDKYMHAYISYLTSKSKGTETLVKNNPFVVLSLFAGSSAERAVNSDEVLKGMKEVSDYRIPIIGGNAGDDFKLKGTYQFVNGKIYTDAAISILISSDIKFSYASEHGYKPTSKLHLVTKAYGGLLKELDKKPALDVYAKEIKLSHEEINKQIFQLGVRYPLGSPDSESNYLLKAPGAILGKNIICAANLVNSSAVSIMKTSEKQLLDAAKKAAEKAKKELNGNISGAIIFSCAMRKAQLTEKCNKELELIKKVIGNVPMIGFYTYGEQVAKGSVTNQQNINITIILFSDNLSAK